MNLPSLFDVRSSPDHSESAVEGYDMPFNCSWHQDHRSRIDAVTTTTRNPPRPERMVDLGTGCRRLAGSCTSNVTCAETEGVLAVVCHRRGIIPANHGCFILLLGSCFETKPSWFTSLHRCPTEHPEPPPWRPSAK